jgi:hypothetical protein
MVKVREDLKGRRFGRLTVLYQTEDYVSPKGQHFAMWHCVCDCDNHNEVDVKANNLRTGTTTSCGCVAKESKRINGTRSIHFAQQANKKYNKYYIDNNIVYIKLSNCNEYTTINLDRWNEISYIKEFYWYRSNRGYVVSRIPKKYQDLFEKTVIGLHQLICPCEKGLIPDHKDRNKLNNLTDNLKPATYRENNQNKNLLERKTHINNTSGHRGVHYNRLNSRWYARISVGGKRIYLGCFEHIEEAIQARKQAEEKYFGDFKSE